MPRASLNLIIKIIVFEKLAGQPSPVRTPSLEQRTETPELKLQVPAMGTHRVLGKAQLSVMLSDSWDTPGTPLLDCSMCPGQAFGVFCHHKMALETSFAGLVLASLCWRLTCPRVAQKTRQLILLPCFFSVLLGSRVPVSLLPVMNTFKGKKLETWF